MKKLPQKPFSDNYSLQHCIGEIIDYIQDMEYRFMKQNSETLPKEMEEKTEEICNRLMHTGVDGDWHCHNKLPCSIHNKQTTSPLPKNWGNVDAFGALVDIETMQKADKMLGKVFETMSLREETKYNRDKIQNSYTKGIECGKKQEREMMKREIEKFIERWRNEGDYSVGQLLRDLKKL